MATMQQSGFCSHFKPQVDIEKSIKNTTKEVLLDEINAISEQCDFSYIEQQEML
jgi:UTP--glucose-1-phosphate uridylyltransferase